MRQSKYFIILSNAIKTPRKCWRTRVSIVKLPLLHLVLPFVSYSLAGALRRKKKGKKKIHRQYKYISPPHLWPLLLTLNVWGWTVGFGVVFFGEDARECWKELWHIKCFVNRVVLKVIKWSADDRRWRTEAWTSISLSGKALKSKQMPEKIYKSEPLTYLL